MLLGCPRARRWKRSRPCCGVRSVVDLAAEQAAVTVWLAGGWRAAEGVGPDGRRVSPAAGVLALGQRASADLSSYGRALPVLQSEAAGVLVCARVGSVGAGEARRVQAYARRLERRGGNTCNSTRASRRAFGRRSAADILRRVLVLLADHELNASTFATRVAVSTGAPLSAGVLEWPRDLEWPVARARGARGVGASRSAERAGAEVAVRDWLSQGRPIAGFGHPLYPRAIRGLTALLPQLTLPRNTRS